MADDDVAVAAKHFESGRTKDFDTFRSQVVDDVIFDGSMGHAGNVDECAVGIKGMSKMVTGIDVKKILTNGSDVVTHVVRAPHRRHGATPHRQLDSCREREDHQDSGDL